jgi:hypothetical protein
MHEGLDKLQYLLYWMESSWQVCPVSFLQVVTAINHRKEPSLPALQPKQLLPRDIQPLENSVAAYQQQPQCVDAVTKWFACDAESFAFRRAA